MAKLTPQAKIDIIKQQIKILENSEGVTQDMINNAYNLLESAEEEEVNYSASLDYLSDQDLINMEVSYYENKIDEE
tara:strand:+ start:141 stop:368 length:228 start_codon:yes stop_codon:yes gene_type:complete